MICRQKSTEQAVNELKRLSPNELLDELCKAAWWDSGGTAEQYLRAEILRRLGSGDELREAEQTEVENG
jgi:hypothetical protein